MYFLSEKCIVLSTAKLPILCTFLTKNRERETDRDRQKQRQRETETDRERRSPITYFCSLVSVLSMDATKGV